MNNYLMVATIDIAFILGLYLSISLIYRDMEKGDEKAPKWALKVERIVFKYKLHIITYLLLSVWFVSGVLKKVDHIISSSSMTELQKFSMINVGFVLIATLVLFMFFDKVRLFKKDKAEA
ncbi:hypothetical protein [Lysinibacillus fusiformis]|uniref:hypothetical protein n=1 Tax=Lysinibacillus fusiformis TaxID=28031 RepID=UPI003D0636C9